MEGFGMTSPMLRMLAERISEEQHQRRADGRELTSVSVAPFVAEALSEEIEEMSRLDDAPEVGIEGMTVQGVGIEPDDDLSVMEFDQ
jgi:hypothetical protein